LAVAGEGKYLCTSSVELNRPVSNDKLEFMRKWKSSYRFWRENIREIHHLEFVDLDKRIQMQWIFRK
jgi:hypothetical protein